MSTVTLNHTPDPNTTKIAEFLQQQLQAAGMTVTLSPIQQAQIINTALLGTFEAQVWRQFNAVNPDLNYIFWSPTNASSPASPSTWPATPIRPWRPPCIRDASPPTQADRVSAYQEVSKLMG